MRSECPEEPAYGGESVTTAGTIGTSGAEFSSCATSRTNRRVAQFNSPRTARKNLLDRAPVFIDASYPIYSGAGSLDDDLDGRWFSDDAYALGGLSLTGFCIRVNGAASAAPRADQVDGTGSNPVIIRTMNQDGQLRANGTAACTGGTVLN